MWLQYFNKRSKPNSKKPNGLNTHEVYSKLQSLILMKFLWDHLFYAKSLYNKNESSGSVDNR